MQKIMRRWAKAHAVRYFSEFVRLSGNEELADKLLEIADGQWQKLNKLHPDIPSAIPIGAWEFMEKSLRNYFVLCIGESQPSASLTNEDDSICFQDDSFFTLLGDDWCRPPLYFEDDEDDDEDDDDDDVDE